VRPQEHCDTLSLPSDFPSSPPQLRGLINPLHIIKTDTEKEDLLDGDLWMD
jgi:hypothetical protein